MALTAEQKKERAVKAAKSRWTKEKTVVKVGRKKGSRNREKVLEESLNVLHASAPKIMQKAVEMALQGDRVALKLCLERLIPLDSLDQKKGGDEDTVYEARVGADGKIQITIVNKSEPAKAEEPPPQADAPEYETVADKLPLPNSATGD